MANYLAKPLWIQIRVDHDSNLCWGTCSPGVARMAYNLAFKGTSL